jgi:hypothetical protein
VVVHLVVVVVAAAAVVAAVVVVAVAAVVVVAVVEASASLDSRLRKQDEKNGDHFVATQISTPDLSR